MFFDWAVEGALTGLRSMGLEKDGGIGMPKNATYGNGF